MQWTEQQKQDLKDILAIAPLASSCDAAVMLEKPCNEVTYSDRGRLKFLTDFKSRSIIGEWY
jgi:hypothetical protein